MSHVSLPRLAFSACVQRGMIIVMVEEINCWVYAQVLASVRDRRGHVRLLAWSILHGADASTWAVDRVVPDRVDDACSSTASLVPHATPKAVAPSGHADWQVCSALAGHTCC